MKKTLISLLLQSTGKKDFFYEASPPFVFSFLSFARLSFVCITLFDLPGL